MSEIFFKKYKYLSFSIASSLASKIANALVTFFAMPLILIRLGVDNFAIYSMILALTGCFAMLNLGIAPYLIVNVSDLLHKNSVKTKKIISTSAFYLILFYSLTACLTFITFISFIDLTYIFPEKYSSFFRSIYLSVLILIFFNFINSLLNVFESIQIAYKELHLFNLHYAAGSMFVLCLLYFNHNLSFIQVIVLSLLPIYLARLLNLVVFLKKHLYLFPSLSFFNFKKSLGIFKSSVSLSFAGGISNFLSHILPILIIGKISSSTTTAEFAFLLNVIIGLSGILNMFILPILPLLPEYKNNCQISVIRQYLFRFLIGVFFLGTFSFLLLYFVKNQQMNIFEKNQITFSSKELIFAYVYFILMSFENIYYNFLVGLNNYSKANKLIFFRAFLGIILLLLLVDYQIKGLPFICMSLSIILVDFFPLRLLLSKSLVFQSNEF